MSKPAGGANEEGLTDEGGVAGEVDHDVVGGPTAEDAWVMGGGALDEDGEDLAFEALVPGEGASAGHRLQKCSLLLLGHLERPGVVGFAAGAALDRIDRHQVSGELVPGEMLATFGPELLDCG